MSDLSESSKAANAFHEYCKLGATGTARSLAKLAQKLGKPSGYARQLETWSSQYHWQDRVKQFDEEMFKAEEEEIAAERKKVLRTGFALMHKRVELLDRKITQLRDITDNENTIWLDDVKSVGTGPNAERVDLVQFNSDAFKELREYMDDMAAEMGERIKKKELSITTLPKVYVDLDVDEDGVDRE